MVRPRGCLYIPTADLEDAVERISRATIAVAVVALGLAVVTLELLRWDAGQVYSAVVLLIVFMVAGVLLRPERRLPWLCDPLVLFLAFQTQFFVVGPIAQSMGFYVIAPLPTSRLLVMIGLFALMLLGFFVGYANRLGRAIGSSLPPMEGGSRRAPGWIFETALIGSALAGCWWYLQFRGGVEFIFREGRQLQSSTSLFLIAFHALIGATILVGFRWLDAPRRSVVRGAILVGLLAFETLLFGLLIGSRKVLFYLFFGMLSVHLLRRGLRQLPKIRVAAALVLLLAFFGFWGGIRARPLQQIVQGVDEPTTQVFPAHVAYLRSVVEPFEVAALCPDIFPDIEPYRMGRTVAVTFLAVIPRAVWPDKPVLLGKELTRYTDGIFYDPGSSHSVTPTLVGDLYANLGVLGTFIGGLLMGVICRVVSTYAATGFRDGVQTSAARVVLPAIFIAGMAEIRASSSELIMFCLLTLTPILMGFLFFRFGSAHPAPAGEPAPSAAAELPA